MAKQYVIALNLQPAAISVQGYATKLTLPDGCIGICLLFDSKQSAKKYFGKDCKYIEVERVKEDK
jgi:hypothetical protein